MPAVLLHNVCTFASKFQPKRSSWIWIEYSLIFHKMNFVFLFSESYPYFSFFFYFNNFTILPYRFSILNFFFHFWNWIGSCFKICAVSKLFFIQLMERSFILWTLSWYFIQMICVGSTELLHEFFLISYFQDIEYMGIEMKGWILLESQICGSKFSISKLSFLFIYSFTYIFFFFFLKAQLFCFSPDFILFSPSELVRRNDE